MFKRIVTFFSDELRASFTASLIPYDTLEPLPGAGTVVLRVTSKQHGQVVVTLQLQPPPSGSPWGLAAVYDAATLAIPAPFPPALVQRALNYLSWRFVYVDPTGPSIYWPSHAPLTEQSPWGIFPDAALYERVVGWAGIKGAVWNLADDAPVPDGLEILHEWSGPARVGVRYLVVRSKLEWVSPYSLLHARGVECHPCDAVTSRWQMKRMLQTATDLDSWSLQGHARLRELYDRFGWPLLMQRAGLPAPECAEI